MQGENNFKIILDKGSGFGDTMIVGQAKTSHNLPETETENMETATTNGTTKSWDHGPAEQAVKRILAKMDKRDNVIAYLKQQFPGISGICKTESLGKSLGGIHLGDAAEGGTINGDPAAEYWDSLYRNNETPGIHDALSKTLSVFGFFIEWANAGEIEAWEI